MFGMRTASASAKQVLKSSRKNLVLLNWCGWKTARIFSVGNFSRAAWSVARISTGWWP